MHFLLSADVYELNSLKFDDAFGENKNASKSDFGGVPSLAAGTFKVPFLKGHYFAWAILFRQNQNMALSYKNEVYDDVIENFPGSEYFGAEVSLTSKSKEQWYGFSWAYPISERWSIGASAYLSAIDNRKGNIITLQALSESNHVAQYRQNRVVSVSNYKMLGKVGLSYQSENIILGFTVLTPSVKLMGDGNFQHEFFFSGIEGESESDDIYITSYQKGLPSYHRSPWAIGAGTTFIRGKSKINLSAEWYSSTPEYNQLKAADYPGQSIGEIYSFSLLDKMESVINAGFGLEFYLSEKVSFFTSFSTDFSTVPKDITAFVENKEIAYGSVFKSDFYHYGGGFVLNLNGADITLGVTYTGANLKFPRPFTFPGSGDDDIFDEEAMIDARWNRMRVVFSFSLPFLKDVQKKAEEKLNK